MLSRLQFLGPVPAFTICIFILRYLLRLVESSVRSVFWVDWWEDRSKSYLINATWGKQFVYKCQWPEYFKRHFLTLLGRVSFIHIPNSNDHQDQVHRPYCWDLLLLYVQTFDTTNRWCSQSKRNKIDNFQAFGWQILSKNCAFGAFCWLLRKSLFNE